MRGSGADIEAHHIVPIKDGGSHKKSNLVTLCTDCHNAVHNGTTAPTATESDSGYVNYTTNVLADVELNHCPICNKSKSFGMSSEQNVNSNATVAFCGNCLTRICPNGTIPLSGPHLVIKYSSYNIKGYELSAFAIKNMETDGAANSENIEEYVEECAQKSAKTQLVFDSSAVVLFIAYVIVSLFSLTLGFVTFLFTAIALIFIVIIISVAINREIQDWVWD